MTVQPHSNSHKFNISLLFLVCVLTYVSGIHNGFVVDDYLFLSGKYDTVFRSVPDYFTVSQSQHYQPLYFLVNHSLAHLIKGDPMAYRLINIGLLWGACLSLYFLIVMLNNQKKATALLTSLLFAVHPLTANSVHQTTHNVVLICMIGMLLSMICYLLYLEKKRAVYLGGSLLSFLIALLCVEAALLTPVYLIAILLLFKGKKLPETLSAILPFAGVFAMFIVLWINVALKNILLQDFASHVQLSLPIYICSYITLLGWYLQNLLWPHRIVLSFNILHPAASGGALLLLLIGIGLLVLLWRIFAKNKENRLAMVWAGAGFIYIMPALLSHPYMGLVLSPHWLLIPSVGFYLLTANLLMEMKISSALKNAVIAVLIAYFVFFTLQYQRIARTALSFCSYWVDRSPHNAVALFELAHTLAQDGRTAQAIDMYERLLRTGAYRSNPGMIYANLASLFSNRGDLAKAEEMANRALDYPLTKIYASAVFNTLGVVDVSRKNNSKAEGHLRQAYQLNARNTSAIYNLSDLYIMNKQDELAIKFLEAVPRQDLPPNDRHLIMARLAGLYFRRNDTQKGFDTIEQIIKQNSSFDSFLQIAAILKAMGIAALPEAIYEAGIKAYPEKARQPLPAPH